jgi:hypothetical protein
MNHLSLSTAHDAATAQAVYAATGAWPRDTDGATILPNGEATRVLPVRDYNAIVAQRRLDHFNPSVEAR